MAVMATLAGFPAAMSALAENLNELFRRVLDDGERTRAMRPSGPSPWTPEPQDEALYDDLEPEQWDQAP